MAELTLNRNDSAGAAGAPTKPLMKGQQTRAAILDAALKLASHIGLEGLSIGALAEVTQMSKSGVFAHFGSREELQISVVREYHDRFEEEVFSPALREPRGLPRLRALFERWVQPRLGRDRLGLHLHQRRRRVRRPARARCATRWSTMVQTWQPRSARAIRAAIAEGHLRADTDPQQLLFEIHGLILALHHDARFLRNPAAAARARAGFDAVR